MTSQAELGYSCEKQQTYRILFDKPIMLVADQWYVVCASISSPSGSSSDAGSSGQTEIQGQDKLVCGYCMQKTILNQISSYDPGY